MSGDKFTVQENLNYLIPPLDGRDAAGDAERHQLNDGFDEESYKHALDLYLPRPADVAAVL